MRFNEKEIKTLACQHKCEKEGNLFFRERQDGFFRKGEGDFIFILKTPFYPTPQYTFRRNNNFVKSFHNKVGTREQTRK